ncbi:gamma-glutamyl kinase [Tropicimonas aquimaris]|uniref:Gamma-glutamyl kinase n=1 Tax=Tropicimonas aquimaris TaxID=914152 RepID=A0ABW3IKK8_9RHOB
MMIFWEARLVLLAVPKTGTQALQAALGAEADVIIRNPPLQKHMPLRWYQRSVLPLFSAEEGMQLETVAVIREPLDWLGSWYRYRRRESLSGRPNSTADLSFQEFVAAYLQPSQPPYAEVGRQSRFVSAPGKAVAVDHLFAYEHFPTLLRFLEGRLGHRIRLGRTNVSPAGELDLPDSMAQLAARKLKDEFSLHKIAVAASVGQRDAQV